RRFANGRRFFDRSTDVVRFIILGALLSPMLSAGIGVTSLALGKLASWDQFPAIALTWWLGDAVSVLVLVPLFLGWITLERRFWPAWRMMAAGLLFLFVVLVAGTVFGDWFGLMHGSYPVSYVVLPCVVWAALRFPQYVSVV